MTDHDAISLSAHNLSTIAYERGLGVTTDAELEAAWGRLLALRWQGIESAPRDGEPVLLHKPDERMVGPYTLAGYWGEWPGECDGWIACDGKPLGYRSSVALEDQGYPTAWMPLPPPPVAGKGGV